jgi:hypothetical protein
VLKKFVFRTLMKFLRKTDHIGLRRACVSNAGYGVNGFFHAENKNSCSGSPDIAHLCARGHDDKMPRVFFKTGTT